MPGWPQTQEEVVFNMGSVCTKPKLQLTAWCLLGGKGWVQVGKVLLLS